MGSSLTQGDRRTKEVFRSAARRRIHRRQTGGSRLAGESVAPDTIGNPAPNVSPMPPSSEPHLRDEADLDDRLTRPGESLVREIPRLASPLVILGAGGKMGPSLAVLARRAAEAAGHPLRVLAISRFPDPSRRAWLEDRGVETVTADLLDPEAVARLPDAPEVIVLVGRKFGTEDDPATTWATYAVIPALVAHRYRRSRLVALSTGNVYPLVPVDSGGADESLAPRPVGEYAYAAAGGGRVFEWSARRHDTPLAILRLNYAIDLRYGVLHDLALRVWRDEPVDLTQGYFNCIWQGDANALILRALPLADRPPLILNLTGPAIHSVREICDRLGRLLHKVPRFTGRESSTALLSNPRRLCQLLGEPPTSIESMLAWTADWVARGGRSYARPTHFEARDGRF